MASLSLRSSCALAPKQGSIRRGGRESKFRVLATAAGREASPAPSSVHHESREELRKHGAVVHEELYPHGTRKPAAAASSAAPPPPPPSSAATGSTHHETREELRAHGAVVHEEVTTHPHATGSHLPGNGQQQQQQQERARHHERHVSPGPQVREPVVGPDSTGAASWVRRSRDEVEGQQQQRAQSPQRE